MGVHALSPCLQQHQFKVFASPCITVVHSTCWLLLQKLWAHYPWHLLGLTLLVSRASQFYSPARKTTHPPCWWAVTIFIQIQFGILLQNSAKWQEKLSDPFHCQNWKKVPFSIVMAILWEGASISNDWKKNISKLFLVRSSEVLTCYEMCYYRVGNMQVSC